ncbi:MAG: hypothetical protein SWH54_04615 [Thermodesulfobacteriota bacterium]|nr:hypothetical protein [Thermodesulfobacteriota bacterium]
MAHKRKQIRDQVKTVLTGLVTTGNRVFVSRVYPLKTSQLPGLLIYTVEEESEPGGSRAIDRMLTLAVEGYVKAIGGAIDDTLDLIAEEVEGAIDADRSLNGLAVYAHIASTEIEFDAESDKPVGIIVMKFSINYRT